VWERGACGVGGRRGRGWRQGRAFPGARGVNRESRGAQRAVLACHLCWHACRVSADYCKCTTCGQGHGGGLFGSSTDAVHLSLLLCAWICALLCVLWVGDLITPLSLPLSLCACTYALTYVMHLYPTSCISTLRHASLPYVMHLYPRQSISTSTSVAGGGAEPRPSA
jgi:hypothetical protein